MSLTYALDLDTSQSPLAVAESLLQAARGRGELAESATAEQLAGGMAASAGWLVRVLAATDIAERLVPGLMAFTPPVSVVFDSNGVEDFEGFSVSMFGLAAWLLETVDGDATMAREGEPVYLARHEGNLVLNVRDDLWLNNELDAFAQPYQRGALRFDYASA